MVAARSWLAAPIPGFPVGPRYAASAVRGADISVMDAPVPSGLSAGCVLATYRATRPVGAGVSVPIPGNSTKGQLPFTGWVCGYSSDARCAVVVPAGTLSDQPRSVPGSTLTVERKGRMPRPSRLASAGYGAIEDVRTLPSFPLRRPCPVLPSPTGRRCGRVASTARDTPACQRSSSWHGIASADVVGVGSRMPRRRTPRRVDPVSGCWTARGQWREAPRCGGGPGWAGLTVWTDSGSCDRRLRLGGRCPRPPRGTSPVAGRHRRTARQSRGSAIGQQRRPGVSGYRTPCCLVGRTETTVLSDTTIPVRCGPR
jgi:hypothetical protein